jgi:spermidine/putrescine transport system permease protein
MDKKGSRFGRFQNLDVVSIGLLPIGFWYLIFLIIPLGILAVYSVWTFRDFEIIPDWTLDNYIALILEPVYLATIIKSFRISFIVTLFSVIIAYIAAYVIAKKMVRWKILALFLIVAPFWTSYILRVYAWMAILGEKGVINSTLQWLGIINEPLQFLIYSQFALVIGFIHIFFPFAVLAIYASLIKIDDNLIAAARDLGANPLQAFITVTLPLSMPGVVAATIFVFLPVLGEYVTPRLLGGPTGTMISTLLANQFGASMQWGIGSAIGFILMFIMFVLVTLLTRKYSLEKLY